MGIPSDATVAPGDPRGMKIDPLHWGCHIVKSKMADKVNSVKSRHGATAMKARFDCAWLLFDKKVQERVVVSFQAFNGKSDNVLFRHSKNQFWNWRRNDSGDNERRLAL